MGQMSLEDEPFQFSDFSPGSSRILNTLLIMFAVSAEKNLKLYMCCLFAEMYKFV